MKNVSFVIPEKQQHQIKGMINYYLVSNDHEIEKYLTRLAATIKSINDYYDIDPQNYHHQFQPINRSPLGRFNHGKDNNNEVGFLKAPSDDCIARNIDKSNRLVAFELDKGVIAIVNVLGHYEQNVFNEKGYIERTDKDLKELYKDNKQKIQTLKESSEVLLNTLFSCVNVEQLTRFNNDCQSDVFPTGLDSIGKSFDSISNAIQDHMFDTSNKSISVVKHERTKLDKLDDVVYRTLRNIYNLSYFIARASSVDDWMEMEKLVEPNAKSISQFMGLVKEFNKKRFTYEVPTDAIDKNLKACIRSLNNSFNYSINGDVIKAFVSTFKNEVNLDIQNILKKNMNHKGEFQESNFVFKNTTILLEELNTALSKKQPLYILNKTQISENVMYFNVPHEERKQAKELGAKWDINIHYWYVPKGIDLEPFDKKGWPRVDAQYIEKAKQEKEKRDSFREKLKDKDEQKIEDKQLTIKKGRSR